MAARTRATRVRSISKNVVTCVATRIAIPMCSDVRRAQLSTSARPGRRATPTRSRRRARRRAACATPALSAVGWRRYRRAALEESEQVALGDAAGDPAAGELRDLDAVLGGDAAHERRALRANALFETAVRRAGAAPADWAAMTGSGSPPARGRDSGGGRREPKARLELPAPALQRSPPRPSPSRCARPRSAPSPSSPHRR